jgi:hypothetical protein
MMWWWLRFVGAIAADEPHNLIDSLEAMTAEA